MGKNFDGAGFLPDYDGIILRTELAKASGWLITSLYLRGDIKSEVIDSLTRNDKGAVIEARQICQQYNDELERITALSGMSRKDTRDAVWGMFFKNYEGEYTKEDLEKKREEIKDVFIDEMSEPIDGNINFFIKARENGVRLGLVTQTTTRDIERQSYIFKIPLYIFSTIVAVGDENYEKKISKTIGYALACKNLGVNKVIAFEDSKSGLESALDADVPCIGVRDLGSNQDLSRATGGFVICPDLGHLATNEAMNFYKNHSVDEFIDYLKGYESKKAA